MVASELTLNSGDQELWDQSAPFDVVEMIATVISSLKEDVVYENHDQGHTWKFNYGTIEVFVHLSGETLSDTLTVWAPVLSYPVQNEVELFRSILQKNWGDTFEARFSLWNEQIILNYMRTLEDLSPTEISRAITLVATLADEYDESLAEQYGASKA